MDLGEFIFENKTNLNEKGQFIEKLKNTLYVRKKYSGFSEIVFLCVGTDRILGDCLGPVVGSKLTNLFEKYNIFNINVYGTLSENVNYINVKKIIDKINNYHKNACIIVIDAAVSKKENIGKIFVQNGKTILGNGINKNKIQIGDISIKAVVGKDMKMPKYNFQNLQTVSLSLIMEISDIVSNGIFEVIQYF